MTLREKESSSGRRPISLHLLLTETAPVAATDAMRSRGLGNQRNMYTYGKGGNSRTSRTVTIEIQAAQKIEG